MQLWRSLTFRLRAVNPSPNLAITSLKEPGSVVMSMMRKSNRTEFQSVSDSSEAAYRTDEATTVPGAVDEEEGMLTDAFEPNRSYRVRSFLTCMVLLFCTTFVAFSIDEPLDAPQNVLQSEASLVQSVTREVHGDEQLLAQTVLPPPEPLDSRSSTTLVEVQSPMRHEPPMPMPRMPPKPPVQMPLIPRAPMLPPPPTVDVINLRFRLGGPSSIIEKAGVRSFDSNYVIA